MYYIVRSKQNNKIILYDIEKEIIKKVSLKVFYSLLRDNLIYGYDIGGKQENRYIEQIFKIKDYIYFIKGNLVGIYKRSESLFKLYEIGNRRTNKYCKLDIVSWKVSLYESIEGNFMNSYYEVTTTEDNKVLELNISERELLNNYKILFLKYKLGKGRI